MSATSPTQPQPRTYGNWRRGLRPGLFGFGPAATAIAFAVMVCGAGSLILSKWVALAIVVVGGLTLTPLAVRFHGRTGAQLLAARLLWLAGRRRRSHLYVTGLASPVSQAHRLPGILARSVLWEVETGLRTPLGVVVIPQSRHYSVALRCQTDGLDLVDQPVVDQRVARMAQFLSALAREPMLVQAQVTVETTPDPGVALAGEVARTTVEHAPAAARQVLADIVASYPVGAAHVDTWVVLTFKPPARGTWTDDAVCTEIATRLPSLVQSLLGAGASAVNPMSGDDLALTVAAAYDPATASHAAAPGAPTWDNAGPVAAHETWDAYRHDSGTSRTWGMAEAPRGTVYANAFARLADPDPTLLRKRVSIIYRPYSPGAAAALVERDRRDAMFTAAKKRQATARDNIDVQAAEQAAREEATGAGITRFTVLVTATVRNPADLDDAESMTFARAGEARVTLRTMYGSQAAAFAANLPTGVVLPHHASLRI
ncbi:SCO6880 family protein [Hamadaea tsunoensis]|uniref:SCO6880 family protein n=1 Tax=Hamadaea tsunoensis TaxID=53368 RepID=UPI000410C26D|nr:SCO6880 family protein [Hamadaea tsunoensis]